MIGHRTNPFNHASTFSSKPLEHESDLLVSKKRQDSLTDNISNGSLSNSYHSQYQQQRPSSQSGGYNNNESISAMRDTVLQTRGKIMSDFGHMDAELLDRMTIEGFSDYVARERLSSMPHRGSTWDRVLRWAEFYAFQVASYADSIGSFVPESQHAARQIFMLLRSLLELGETNANALNTTFGVFYNLGLSLSFLSSHEGKLSLNSHVREDVGRVFHIIHSLVYDVASYYQRSVRGLSNNSVALDFVELFRGNLDDFYRRKNLIIDHIWRHALGGNASQDVQTLRKWLNQRADLSKSISADYLTYRSQYDEYTCEWFQRHLLDFTRGDRQVLALTAPAGSGKTVLSSWIQERLQRPMDKKTHSTIMFTFDADVPSETSSLALAKNVALQLLDIRLGNVRLYDAIAEAYNSDESAAVEKNLWAGIDAAFSLSSEPTVIIIDGLDHLQGNVSELCNKLTELSTKHAPLKTIVLSRPETPIPRTDKQWRFFDIKPDYVYEDLRHIATNSLREFEPFLAQKDADQKTTIEYITKTAQGSFLWVLLTAEGLKKSKSVQELHKNVENVFKTLEKVIEDRVKLIDFSDSDIKLLLSYMLVAERPMTTREYYDILQVDTKNKSITHRNLDVAAKLVNTAGLVQVNETGLVKFRHSAIRSYFTKMQSKGDKVMPLKDAETDLTLRLLLYGKACLTKKHDVCLERLPTSEVDRLHTEHKSLEYVVRNWNIHFRRSHISKPDGSFDFPPDFRALFPASPHFVLLEWGCWDEQVPKNDLIEMHDLTLRIRTGIYGDKHECTLQNIITCGFVHYKHSAPEVAAQYFYRASRVAQTVLPKFSKVTISLTEWFLAITEPMKFTKRTDIVTWREEMLKFIITVSKHEHSETSDVVVRYYQILSELYKTIHEEENSSNCLKELRVIIVNKHGEGSEAEREISGKLMVVLKGNDDFKIDHYRGDIFAIGEENAVVWDTARIMVYLKLALGCEQRKEFHEAEELYVTLWTRLLNLSKQQYSNDIEFRVNMLKIAVEYTHFLRRQNRHEEAKNILIVIWTEHKDYGCESEEFYRQLMVIGEQMKALNLLSISTQVFEKSIQWYRAVGKHDNNEVRRCENSIYEAIEEITKRQTSNKSQSSEDVETVMRRMFSSTTVMSKEYVKTTRAVLQLHVKREQWQEAINVLTKALQLMWSKNSWGGEVCLPDQFADETIEFTIELGKSHMKLKHQQECLSCYLQLWQAVRGSLDFNDKRRQVILDVLVNFYTDHKRWKSLIELHKELSVEYRRNLGKTHERTIAILYNLGDLILEHGHGDAAQQYREIVEAIGSTDIKKSFKAYKMLSQIYYDENNWVELKVVNDVLWNQLITNNKEHDFTADFVENLYIRYMYVMKNHHKSDHKQLALIASQYKDVCTNKFGSTSAIAVQARIEHASVLMENESTKTQAVIAYEEIITTSKTNKTSIDDSVLSNIKKHLVDAYVHGHKSGTSSPATTEKAIIALQERHSQLVTTLGIAHHETLTTLAQLISMHQNIKGSQNTIATKLSNTVVEIITKEKSSQSLFEAATAIGSIYISCDLRAQGLELMHNIRRQVIADHYHSGKDGIKIDKSVGRVSFVFLVAFEQSLKGSNSSYSEIMANWLTESVLFENFTRALNGKTKVDVLLMRSALLRSFWSLHGRHEEITKLDDRVWDAFSKQFGQVVKTRPEMAKIFLVAVLVHLGSRETYNIQVSKVASMAGNNKVSELLKAGKFQEAQEVGQCTFQFVMSQGGYHQTNMIGFGFSLSGHLAGRGATSIIPAELRGKMLQSSREVMTEVLKACKDLQINFLQLHDHELNELIELLGQQENYKELENILESLWKSRHGQKHWSEDTLINLGARLVESRHLAAKDGHSHGAIHLAEDMGYNLRRVFGGLHPATLSMSTLLSQLYTSAKQYGDAMTVHEEILQLIVAGDDGDDRTPDYVNATVARTHLDLLKAAYQRNGSWVKSPGTYQTLIESLQHMREFRNAAEFKDIQPIQHWTAKPDEKTAQLGLFVKPQVWSFVVEEDMLDSLGGLGSPGSVKSERLPGWSMRRINDNWGTAVGGDRNFSGRSDRSNGAAKHERVFSRESAY